MTATIIDADHLRVPHAFTLADGTRGDTYVTIDRSHKDFARWLKFARPLPASTQEKQDNGRTQR